MGVYIDHPKYENTRKLKILAHTRDKVVIHQNGVVWYQLHKNHKGSNFAMQEDFASLAIFYRDSEIEKFRYLQ